MSDKQKPMAAAGIETPHPNDIICEDVKGRVNHSGNQFFRELVNMYQKYFLVLASTSPFRKTFPAMIVDQIQSENPPGRFLKQDSETKLWHTLSRKEALVTARQALNENSGDSKYDTNHSGPIDDSVAQKDQKPFTTEPSAKAGIETPGPNDVISGRGSNHTGNKNYLELVRKHKKEYVACSFHERKRISEKILDAVNNRSPRGRFLKQDTKSNLWIEMMRKEALSKIVKSLNVPIIQSDEELQMTVTGIETPDSSDILCGNGKGFFNHPGNQYFRKVVKESKKDFLANTYEDRRKYPNIIINKIQNENPPGRFLKQNAETKLWHEISREQAYRKTKKCLLVPITQSDEEQQTVTEIETPDPSDILCVQGRVAKGNPGNKFFIETVRKYKKDFLASSTYQRSRFPAMIIRKIQSENPPRRFLKRNAKTKLWHEISHKEALAKTKKAFYLMTNGKTSKFHLKQLDSDVSEFHGQVSPVETVLEVKIDNATHNRGVISSNKEEKISDETCAIDINTKEKRISTAPSTDAMLEKANNSVIADLGNKNDVAESVLTKFEPRSKITGEVFPIKIVETPFHTTKTSNGSKSSAGDVATESSTTSITIENSSEAQKNGCPIFPYSSHPQQKSDRNELQQPFQSSLKEHNASANITLRQWNDIHAKNQYDTTVNDTIQTSEPIHDSLEKTNAKTPKIHPPKRQKTRQDHAVIPWNVLDDITNPRSKPNAKDSTASARTEDSQTEHVQTNATESSEMKILVSEVDAMKQQVNIALAEIKRLTSALEATQKNNASNVQHIAMSEHESHPLNLNNTKEHGSNSSNDVLPLGVTSSQVALVEDSSDVEYEWIQI